MVGAHSRELIGHAYVDHGGVAIVDPQYAELSAADQDAICGAAAGTPLDCETDESVGVFVASGLGDGSYPVYADVVDVPGAGKRVARIVIDCVGIEDESGDLRERMVQAADALRDNTGGALDVRLPYGDPRTEMGAT